MSQAVKAKRGVAGPLKQRLAVIKRQEQKKMDGWRWDDSWQGMDGSHSEHEYKQIFNPLNDKYM